MRDVEYALCNELNTSASVVSFYSSWKSCCFCIRGSLQPMHQTLVMLDCCAEIGEEKLIFRVVLFLFMSLEFSLLCSLCRRCKVENTGTVCTVFCFS